MTESGVEAPGHTADVVSEEELVTEAVTLDPLPEEATSAYRFDAECSCFVKTILKSKTMEELLGEDLTERPKPEHCDSHGMSQCIEFCNMKASSLTNNLDLKKVPITATGVEVSLGQYLCNLMGSHILPSRVSLYAKLTCKSSGPRHERTTSHLATTGVYSKQRLWCIGGKFRGVM